MAILAATAFVACAVDGGQEPVSSVDPLIGSGGHGHVFVGANVPFGAVQVGPTSITQGWDWCSGYHESDSTVIGFSHTHLSGTGCGDLLDVTIMPVTTPVTFSRGSEDAPSEGAWSYMDRSREIAEPGYYSIPLNRYGITAEMTATQRVGLSRYTFPETNFAAIVIDLQNGGNWDTPVDTGFDLFKDKGGRITAVGGHRFSTGWARDQKIFFYATFNVPIDNFSAGEPDSGNPNGKYGMVHFGPQGKGKEILAKVAISSVSIEGAKANMEAELPGWNFDKVREDARKAWNSELSGIHVSGGSEEEEKIFYTALYHTAIAPSVFNDVDGKYRGSDGEVHEGDFTNYTTFSLWDTYRAEMPLLTITHKEMMDDLVKTMYHIYKEQGDLPVWHLMGNETDCMVGNPGLIAFADAVIKGFRGGLTDEEILDAMVKTAVTPDRGQDFRMEYGYIPCDLYRESVGTDMEYAIADAALANAADLLGRAELADEFRVRSHSYRHFWDPETRFFRGRTSDYRFIDPFNPLAPDQGNHDYTEGNAWQYRYLVPHDLDGLVTLLGSRERALEALDDLFNAPSMLEGNDIPPDITGLIGQYVHGNEPSHHIIYLYSMLGEPDKAADRIREVYANMYTASRDGLSGNEDVGQMSAWLVMSALGFYQVEPACTRLWFGAPLFPKAEISLPGGVFTILAKGLSPDNTHIRGIRLNGEPYTLPYIDYNDIKAGGLLEFTMGK